MKDDIKEMKDYLVEVNNMFRSSRKEYGPTSCALMAIAIELRLIRQQIGHYLQVQKNKKTNTF